MLGYRQPLGWIVLALLLSTALLGGCRGASTKDATAPPTLAAASVAMPAAPLSVSSSPMPAPIASPTPPPSPNPQIDFPLTVDNAWVFQTIRYIGYPPPDVMTTTLVITETVVEVQQASPAVIAKIHQERSAEIPVVVPKSWEGAPTRPAESGDYWLVLRENRLYRQNNKLDLSRLEEALVKFVFPLKTGNKWALTENQTKINPPNVKPGMTRQVVKIDTVDVPAERFTDCYLLLEKWVDANFEDWFCPNVGLVDSKADHLGAPEGWHNVLVRYQVKR